MMTAARWTHCLAQVLAHEGGYVDHPADPGGATNMGITHRTLARWRGVEPWSDLPKEAVKALGRDEAAAIYKALYWDRCRGDDLPAGVDLAVFDFAVNSGPERAISILQALVDVTRDGIVGPITLAAVARRDPAVLAAAICDQRMSFLQRLATWATFGRGWTNRVAAIRMTALADAGTNSIKPQGDDAMTVFDGYKTYIVGALMLAVGLALTAGLDLPSFGDYSGPQLIMEALAVIFLRKGLKSAAGK